MENEIDDWLYEISGFLTELENMKDLVNEVYNDEKDIDINNKCVNPIVDVERMFYELERVLEDKISSK